MAKRNKYLVERRREDVRDEASDCAIQSINPDKLARTADREARRKRRRNTRKDPSKHKDGLSSDDEPSEKEGKSFSIEEGSEMSLNESILFNELNACRKDTRGKQAAFRGCRRRILLAGGNHPALRRLAQTVQRFVPRRLRRDVHPASGRVHRAAPPAADPVEPSPARADDAEQIKLVPNAQCLRRALIERRP